MTRREINELLKTIDQDMLFKIQRMSKKELEEAKNSGDVVLSNAVRIYQFCVEKMR